MLAAHVALLARRRERAGQDGLRPRRGHRRHHQAPPGARRTTGSASTRAASSSAIDVDVRDGRRRVPDAVAGGAVARRAPRGGPVPLPGRRACAGGWSRPTTRRTARSAASARRRPRSPTSARCRSSRARSARIRSRCASGSRCARATPPPPARCSGSRSAPTRCSTRSSGVAGPPPARDGTTPTARRSSAGAACAFYFHGAGFTGSGEQRLAGRGHGRAPPPTAASRCARARPTSARARSRCSRRSRPPRSASRAERIAVVDPSTARVPDSGPTVASRTCMVVGGLVERASRALRGQLEAWAAEHGGGDRARDRGDARAAGRARETVQYEPPPGIAWDDATYTGSAYPVYGWAACLVDVAVDLDTYEVTIDRCVQAVDVGKAINPSIVKGQIEGGTLQALGWALLENVRLQGRPGRQREHDQLHRADVRRRARARDHPGRGARIRSARSGAKGVGEIPMDGPAAAVANAVEDALGVRVRRAAAVARGDRAPRSRAGSGVVKIDARGQRRAAHGRGLAVEAAARRAARGPPADRHQGGLRRGRVRRLHGAARRRGRQLVPGRGRPVRRPQGHHRRGAGARRRAARGAARAGRAAAARSAASARRASRCAPRTSSIASARRRDEASRAPGPRAARRQHLPLHRLPADRRRGRSRRPSETT